MGVQLSTGFLGSVIRLRGYGSVHWFMLDSRHRMLYISLYQICRVYGCRLRMPQPCACERSLSATQGCPICTFQTVKGWDLMMDPPHFQVHLSYTAAIHCSPSYSLASKITKNSTVPHMVTHCSKTQASSASWLQHRSGSQME